MNYSITRDNIQTINLDKYAPFFTDDNTRTEFLGLPGKEHYRLLAYFSTLFNNTNIIDIGTHRANSALALSYNDTNIIHTFDIIDKVNNDNIKNTKNIHFHIENLLEPIVQ